MDTPLSIEVVPKAVMQDQQAIQLSDVTKNVSSVYKGTSLGGFVDQFMIRGFNTSYTNYYDGYRFPQGSGLSLANAERVEVIKGAAANLYGRVEPGGMINVLTKRPQKKPYYALEQQFGSYDLYRTTADATGTLTKNDNLLYRLNVEYLNKKSFRDYAFNDRVFVAPSLTWKLSDRTQLDLDFIYSDQKSLIDYGVPANSQTHRPANIPISRYLGEPSTDKSHSTLYNTAATLTHAITDNWKVSAKFNYVNRILDIPQTLPLSSPQPFVDTTGELLRAYVDQQNNLDSYFGTLDITGKFTTGIVKHKFLAGWDNYNVASTSQNYLSLANPINIYNPQYQPIDTSQVQKNFQNNNLQWNGVYFQDQITLFDKLHILGGGRYDWMSETAGFSDQSLALASTNNSNLQNGRFNPRAGLLYQPWQWLSLYSNYIESSGAANTNMGVNGKILQPETAEQVEAGFKTAFFEDRLTSTVAFYSLTKQNMIIPIAGTFFSEAINKARSQGIEMDIAGRISENLNLIANYTYTEAVILESNLKRVNAGNQLWNVPKNAGSLWAKYDLQQETLRGLSLGAGVFFQGQKQGDIANTYQLPGFGRVDALVKYKLLAAKTTLQFNVENVLNQQYYAASLPNNIYAISPGAPITFMGSVKVEF
jgi:iron complex outermembrane receptor protein